MVMLLPALGESAIPTRMRLTVALLLALVLYPAVQANYPPGLLDNFLRLAFMFGGELALGFAIGLCTKMITSALTTAGMIIASQSSLAMALGTDVTNAGQQGTLVSNYLSILGITLIFVTDTHYLVIAALYDSFTLFTPGNLLPLGDFAQMATETFASVFSIAVRLSAPFIVVGIVFYFGLGLLNKLMPQMQIFFIAMPVNIAIGLGLLMVLLTTMMTFYLSHFEEAIGKFTLG